jgi:IS30 family transposase
MDICKIREKPPYVCNGCVKRGTCTMEKALYNAQMAHNEYLEIQRESRAGICADESEVRRIDTIISPLIRKGQSIHHILINHKNEIMHSEKTVYNYVDMSLFSARNIDMPRKVRFRPRKSRHEGVKIDRMCRIGRTYEDYISFKASNPDRHIVEMDTVYGVRGGKVLLTLEFVAVKYMIIILLESCTGKEVENAFNHLYALLGPELFSSLFRVILTDNGSEFTDPDAIEVDSDGVVRTQLFYCEPYMSQQKGALENCHEMIRRISPKGRSLDHLTQTEISTMMNHINSYGRKILNDQTPHRMFECMFGSDAVDRLGAELIPPDLVILHPSLLSK